jgi:hypothetical protein
MITLVVDKINLSYANHKSQSIINRQKKREEAVTPSHRMSERRSILRGGMAREASAAL